MCSKKTNFARSERGALLLETALVTPMLIVLFISVAQFGFAYYIQATMQSAVRAAVRDEQLVNGATVAPSDNFYACNSATITGAPQSIGAIVCDYIDRSGVFGAENVFQVKAEIFDYDNETSDLSDDVEDMVRVSVQIPLTEVIFIDYNGLLTGGTNLEAYAVMKQEP